MYPDMPLIRHLIPVLEVNVEMPDYDVIRQRYDKCHVGLDYDLWGLDLEGLECTLA